MKKRNDSQARSNSIFQQARLCQQSGISRAVTLYGQVLSEQPRHTDSLYHLGEIAFAGKMAQSAALLTSSVADRSPVRPSLRHSLAGSPSPGGDTTGAIRVLERRLELRPRDAYPSPLQYRCMR